MICPQHGIEFQLKPAGVSKRTGQPYNAFYACPTYGCKERPPREGNYAPRPNSYATEKPNRNFDREAYEKCCSIWLAGLMGHVQDEAHLVAFVEGGQGWRIFQAIRKDGERRFSPNKEAPKSTLGFSSNPPPQDYQSDEPPLEAYVE